MDLSKWAEKKGKSIDETRKKFAFSIFKGIVLATPVDTGRARGNWQIGINEDITHEIDRNCPNGENINSEPIKLNYVQGDEKIFISNNLPYIQKLEYGSSKQAPQGMVGKVLANRERNIKRALEKE